MPAECFDVSKEASLLVDPARESPLDHIRWRPINAAATVPEERLVWAPMHRTQRGDVTVRVLGLRGELSDHVGRHIRACVWPRVRTLRAYSSGGRADLVRSEWDAMLSDLIAPDAPYAAASHDALDYFVPRVMRAQWGLSLPRPGALGEPSPARDLADPDGFQYLPVRLRWRIRADDEPLEALVIDACRARPWSVDELALLFNRSAPYMDGLVRGWVEEGKLAEVLGASSRRLSASPV